MYRGYQYVIQCLVSGSMSSAHAQRDLKISKKRVPR